MSFATGTKLDFITKKSNAFEAGNFQRRRRSRISDIEFWVISKEDLILSKLWWAKDSHSERQFEDIQRLIESGVDEQFIDGKLMPRFSRNLWRRTSNGRYERRSKSSAAGLLDVSF
jgi:hypothetical protein